MHPTPARRGVKGARAGGQLAPAFSMRNPGTPPLRTKKRYFRYAQPQSAGAAPVNKLRNVNTPALRTKKRYFR